MYAHTHTSTHYSQQSLEPHQKLYKLTEECVSVCVYIYVHTHQHTLTTTPAPAPAPAPTPTPTPTHDKTEGEARAGCGICTSVCDSACSRACAYITHIHTRARAQTSNTSISCPELLNIFINSLKEELLSSKTNKCRSPAERERWPREAKQLQSQGSHPRRPRPPGWGRRLW